jgi:hypothetical protein
MHDGNTRSHKTSACADYPKHYRCDHQWISEMGAAEVANDDSATVFVPYSLVAKFN